MSERLTFAISEYLRLVNAQKQKRSRVSFCFHFRLHQPICHAGRWIRKCSGLWLDGCLLKFWWEIRPLCWGVIPMRNSLPYNWLPNIYAQILVYPNIWQYIVLYFKLLVFSCLYILINWKVMVNIVRPSPQIRLKNQLITGIKHNFKQILLIRKLYLLLQSQGEFA